MSYQRWVFVSLLTSLLPAVAQQAGSFFDAGDTMVSAMMVSECPLSP
jgi:hypothetical protein